MYLSKFSAFNYRSLKRVSIRLEDGKNVIVGKNNSGKSNIIRGLEVLIGEKFPTYQNITDNDFYTYEAVDEDTGEINEVVADHMYLDAELAGRDFDEEMIKTIKKKTAFSKVKSITSIFWKDENREVNINYDYLQSLDEIEQREETESLGTNNGGYPILTSWKNPDQVIVFLKSAKVLKLFFTKSRVDDEKSGFGLICIDQVNGLWVTHFLSKKLRNSLITTTVISALRSQKEDLRLVHYTWFGKLIMGIWECNKSKIHPTHAISYEDLVKEKSTDIKQYVDAVFHSETDEIRKILEGAIAYKTVSFKFMNDTKNELYKNVQLFINDGIDRPLYEKGTGIQSAIIISLFSLYCNKYHNNSSLLIAEEPELYLHPQARRVISAELDKFLVSSPDQPRQLILSTHSTEYLRNVEPYNIIRVYKDHDLNCSIAKQLDHDTSQQLTTELKRFLWSNNTELFFADKVVLVEGGEVYLIPALVDCIMKTNQLLDYHNISITRVNGKGSFLTYVKMLQCFDIEFVVLGDLDCFKDEVSKLAAHLKLDSLKKTIDKIRESLSKSDINYEAIDERIRHVDKNFDAQGLQNVFERLANGKIEKDDEDLHSILTYMKSRYTKGDKKSLIIDMFGEEDFKALQAALRKANIFIWSEGELESYYSYRSKQLSGTKDLKALGLSYLLKTDVDINDLFVHTEEIDLLVEIILPVNCYPKGVAHNSSDSEKVRVKPER